MAKESDLLLAKNLEKMKTRKSKILGKQVLKEIIFDKEVMG